MNPTKHTFADMHRIIDEAFPNLEILKYYPYGRRTQYPFFTGGFRDLRKEYLRESNRGRSQADLVHLIIEEVGRAMNYLVRYGVEENYDHQRIKAFCMWRLFHNGVADWNKDIIKGKSIRQIEALEKYHKNRSDMLHANGRYADERSKRQEAEIRALYTPEVNKAFDIELDALNEIAEISTREQYGIFQVTHFPLTQPTNVTLTPRIFYTKKELAAIWLMVEMAFENLC